jgi:hypothetical protein
LFIYYKSVKAAEFGYCRENDSISPTANMVVIILILIKSISDTKIMLDSFSFIFTPSARKIEKKERRIDSLLHANNKWRKRTLKKRKKTELFYT